MLTNADIRELIGKQPSATFRDENGDTVEVYKWRAGMPVRTYDLFAVFRENGGRLLFYRHAMGKYETGNEILQIASESPSQIPSENREVDSGQMDADSGNPGDAGQDEPTRPEANEDTEGPVGDALPTKSLPPQPGNGPAETEGGSSAEEDNAPAEEDNAARSESHATSKESVAPDSEQEKSLE